MMTERKILRMAARRRRLSARIRLKSMADRVEIQAILDRNGHKAIRIRMSRSVIGHVFEHARSTEALATYRLEKPVYMQTWRMLELVRAFQQRTTEQLWGKLVVFGNRWRKERKPVRHRRYDNE